MGTPEAERDYQALLKEIKVLQVKLDHSARYGGAGESLSFVKGKGMEFHEMRPYVDGDDIKSIDWNATARLNKPFVKVYQEEHEFSVLIALDISASQDFGSQDRTKKYSSLKAVATIAFSMMSHGNKVGFIAFDGTIVHYEPPLKNKNALYAFLKQVFFYETPKKSDLTESLREINQVVRKRSIIFLVSDFFDEGPWFPYLADLSIRHDLFVIHFFDPLEKSFPSVGLVHFEDIESGEKRLLDTSTKDFQSQYQKLFQRYFKKTEKAFQSLSLRFLQLENDGDFYVKLSRFLKK